MKSAGLYLLDASAIGLSGLCLLHCIALPVLAAFLPMLAIWSKAAWVHLLLVVLAAPLAAAGFWRSHRLRPLPWALWGLAMAGLAALLAGALGWTDENRETSFTVAGSMSLASAHLWNWCRRHRIDIDAGA
ncbi:MerC domain-containing protein [Marilutibacter chinensis]|uniref:MerC domain-containing protein n=1 Tax=Marilutibacter chinensis TaxID=2912247 RepID=A0ABS9HQR3_9GAMM|nr:MerC domain-containing protein [Lysobacter chinensis]MCF7221271.1 MerC domain-containing protein [Lysobacter chinensis]MCF7222988.1 MerC domain-containing protein [Lysobacter chinensis]